MIRFRLILISVFVSIVLLLFVEQSVQLPLIGSIQLALYVYVIAGLILAAFIAYPELAQKPAAVTFLPVLAFYGLWKTIYSTSMVIDPSFIYVALAEIVVLYLTLVVARIISQSISNMETSIHNVVFQLDNVKVLDAQEGEKAITEEILRARRYERVVTLIYLQIPRLQRKPFVGWSKSKTLEYEYIYARVVQIIRNLIHETDIIAWHKNNLVICLPEASEEEVSDFINQLEVFLDVSLVEKSILSTARFPTDALVYEDLIAVALSESVHEPTPVPLMRRNEKETQPVLVDTV